MPYKLKRPCIKCDSKNTKVVSTDHINPYLIKRYCKCFDCDARFRTLEVHELPPKTPGQPFTEEEIKGIRELHALGLSSGQIALKYKRNSGSIRKIINKQRHKILR